MKNIIIIILFCNVLIFPQQNSVGLISKTDDVSDGYILNLQALKKYWRIDGFKKRLLLKWIRAEASQNT